MTKIEWTEKTLNVISGCTPKSEGCQNCYARKMHKRLAAMGQEKYKAPFETVVFHKDSIAHEFDKLGRAPKMVFVNSMSDTFHEQISDEDIKTILCRCQYNSCLEPVPHTFQILTKRAERLPGFNYPKNVWLGVTVEMGKYKNRIDYLKRTDAKVKFLSCEPLLGDLGTLDLTGIDWVIVGGESGHNARAMCPSWVRNIQKQCAEQNVPFFFKQWGEWVCVKETPTNTGVFCTYDRVGKKQAGSLLDGKEYESFPVITYNKAIVTDKNDSHIHRGDILRTPDACYCHVIFDGFRFAVESPGSCAVDYEGADFYKNCEVVGNIFKTPDFYEELPEDMAYGN